MRLAVVGAGYVGLVVAACLADVGHAVALAERDPARLGALHRGALPIREPGLDTIVSRALRVGRLTLHEEAARAVDGVEAVFVAVGTPPGEDGHPDLTAVFAVVDEVWPVLSKGALLVLKSTVPVGTAVRVRERLTERGRVDVAVVSNPEFLAEGTAVRDFHQPARVVVGCEEPWAQRRMARLYAPFVAPDRPILAMDNASAELAKYASNAMLATRVTLMNELAGLAGQAGADIERVRAVVAADPRVGGRYLYPGSGFGGSCFPKDLLALEATGALLGAPMDVVSAVRTVNTRQKRVVFAMLASLLGSVDGKRVAVWGLAFKAGTDDIRQAPSLVLLQQLVDAGADVVVYDPAAMDAVRARVGDDIAYAASAVDAVRGADALAIVTEWAEFRGVDLRTVAEVMRGRIVVDGRNLYEPPDVVAAGFTYASIGRPVASPGEGHPSRKGT
jgi:UDPglucose 6-dehydrogenase